MSKNFLTILTIIISIIIVCFVIYIGFFPSGRALISGYKADLEKAEQINTNETRKKIEDEARAMVVNYQSDCLIYKQYKNSEDREERSWGQNAKIRANSTAKSYNMLIKNSYKSNNIPYDLPTFLSEVED